MNLPVLNNTEKQPSTLNQVTHFDPADYLTSYANSDGTVSYYLEVKYRILWFRLCYPLGRITTTFQLQDDGSVIAEARIYFDMTLPEEQFAAQAYSHKTKSAEHDHIEWALTAATGRALGLAGFGQQFCDILDKSESEQVDSPVVATAQPQQSTVQCPSSSQQTMQPRQSPQHPAPGQQSYRQQSTPANQPYEQPPAHFGTEVGYPDDDIPVSDPGVFVSDNPPQQAPQSQSFQQNQPVPLNQPIQQSQPQQPALSTDSSEATASLSFNDCLSIVINFGYNKGKYLGDLYHSNDIAALEWLAYTYKGRDTHVKTGAQILLSTLKQAS